MTIEREKKDKLFGEICNKENWKDEINAIIDEDKFDEYDNAVSYFTGGGLDLVESYRDAGS